MVARKRCYVVPALAAVMLAAGPPLLQAETLTFVAVDALGKPIGDPVCVTAANGTVVIEIRLDNIGAAPILGGQFFMQYADAPEDADPCVPPPECWQVTSVLPVAPFRQVYKLVTPPACAPVPGDPGIPGTIDYAVAVPSGNPGVTAPQAMAIVTLQAVSDEPQCCEQELKFREHNPPTRLGIRDGGIEPPALVLGPPIEVGLDWHKPQLTCDDPVTEVPVDSNCEALMPDLVGEGLCSVEDNCCNTDPADDICDCSVTQSPAPGTPMALEVPVSVTITVTDCCGNSNTFVQTVKAVDNTPPEWPVCPGEIHLPNCGGPLCEAWCVAIVPDMVSGAGLPPGVSPMPRPTDNCEEVCHTHPAWTQIPMPGEYIAQGDVISVIAVDRAGNTAICEVVVTIDDVTDPVIQTCPPDREVPVDENCVGEVPDLCPELIGDDNCAGGFDAHGHPLPGVCSQDPPAGAPILKDATVNVVITVTDYAGNSSSCDTAVTAVDETAPEITCPEDIEVYADACAGDDCSAVVAFEVSAADNCDGAPSIVCMAELQDGDSELDTVYPTGTTFPTGSTTVTCRATDDDGNVSEPCDFVVNVLPENEIQVTVQLDGAPAPIPPVPPFTEPTFTRCIKFEVYPCVEEGDPSPVPVLREATIAFDPITRTGTTTLVVPCDCYTCIVAQDPLHTVRRAVSLTALGNCTVPNSDYQALFTGSSALRGGDVDDDGWADIVDVALILFRWGRCYGDYCVPAQPCCQSPVGDPNTDCTFPPPVPNVDPALDTTHVDISGDGFVGLSDLQYLTQATNFLAGDESCISDKGAKAGAGGARAGRTGNVSAGPLQKISVRELQRRGLGQLAAYDLNKDGSVDMKDVTLFLKQQPK